MFDPGFLIAWILTNYYVDWECLLIRTMARVLYQLGYEHSYHSEEMTMLIPTHILRLMLITTASSNTATQSRIIWRAAMCLWSRHYQTLGFRENNVGSGLSDQLTCSMRIVYYACSCLYMEEFAMLLWAPYADRALLEEAGGRLPRSSASGGFYEGMRLR